MGGNAHILIVDDDPHLREVVSFALRQAGHRVEEASDGQRAVAAAEQSPPALIILDIMMPEMDGLEVCRTIRKTNPVPIIFLSSKDDEIDRILGLELGGDDYISKPFSPRELVARVKSVLRRAHPTANSTEGDAPSLQQGRITLDLEGFKATCEGTSVALTVTEFGILRTLMTRPNKVYSRDELMNYAYGGEVVVSDRTIDSHIRRVRQKFDRFSLDPIETVHGVGYKFSGG